MPIRLLSILGATFLAGCASGSVIPASLQAQLDKSLTFPQLRELPDSYRGHLLVLGGEVLSAKRLKEGTRIEVLEIPLDGSLQPGLDRTASRGRFIAVQKEFLDPATIPPGTRLTLVGEVTGAVTDKLDETDYTYPTVEIKALKVWQRPESFSHIPYYYYPPSYYWRPYYHTFGRIRR
ncbi:MAG TPA: Slp family lipoprotein [Nitrospiraceae bacterium]